MMLLVMGVGGAMPDHIPSYISVPIMGATGVVCYLLLMMTVFKRETNNLLSEGTDMLPARIKPLAQGIQRLLERV
jgi:hypothetical protein